MMMSNQLPEMVLKGNCGIGPRRTRPGFEFGYNGVVITDPTAVKLPLGKGSYFWDGLASTWFWVDPTNKIVFVGMV